MKHEEHKIQKGIVDWARMMPPPLRDLLYAIPNGEERPKKKIVDRSGIQRWICPSAKRLKDEGLLPGMPDLHLPMARRGYNSLYVETKTADGKMSAAQKKVFPLLEEQKNHVVIVRTVYQGIGVICWYLGVGESK